ncbi:16023_t:CDS:2, partial [Cetraspora pellucida]
RSLWCCRRNIIAFGSYGKILVLTAFPWPVIPLEVARFGVDHIYILKEVISQGFTAGKYFKKLGYQFSQKDQAEEDLRKTLNKLASMNDDEHFRQAESLSSMIDKHLGSSSVEQYWNSVKIRNEQNTTRVNQIIVEEKKKQHKYLVDSNVITEHNISSNKLTSEFQEIEATTCDFYYERMFKRPNNDGYTSPSPFNFIPGGYSLITNPFIEDTEEDEDNLVVDDIGDLLFERNECPYDYKIRNTNVSQLFRQYQNESIKISKNGGLTVESNVHEILSLSSIFLLIPGSHSKTMIKIFGSQLLDEIHQQTVPTQSVKLNSECELKFREAVKKAKNSRECAIDWFLRDLANDQYVKENLGYVILKGLETLPSEKIRNEPSEITLITNYLDYIMKGTFHHPDKYIVQWPNTALNESKSRKFEGRSKQPDFVVSVIHQLQTESVVFVGEVSPPSQKNNVYKNCNDLIRIGILMKDCLDFSIDKGADINIIGFQCVDYTIDFYTLDLKKGTYFMLHIGQIQVPGSIKEILSFVDELETLLVVREILRKSYNILYSKLCNPESLPSNNAEFKRATLETPKFKQLVNKTRDCNRICPFWYGRF